MLRTLFHKIYGDAHTFVQTKLQTKMMLLEALYIRQCIDLLEGLNVGNSDPTSKYGNFSFTYEYLFTQYVTSQTASTLLEHIYFIIFNAYYFANSFIIIIF